MAPANVPGALTVSASDLATKWAVTSASVSAGRRQQSKGLTTSQCQCVRALSSTTKHAMSRAAGATQT